MQTLCLCKFYSLSNRDPCQIFMAAAIAPKKAANFIEAAKAAPLSNFKGATQLQTACQILPAAGIRTYKLRCQVLAYKKSWDFKF